jgi:ABC-type transport system involved in cytochrome c biogenesis ATPase subunit
MFRWGIKSLTFSGGEEIQLEPDSTLIIVGPNNSGKTLALNNIFNLLTGGQGYAVISKVQFFMEGDEAEFRDWLRKDHPEVKNPQTTAEDLQAWYAISGMWTQLQMYRHLSNRGADIFYRFVDSTYRLAAGELQTNVDFNDPRPQSHIARLLLDPTLRQRVFDEIQKTFNLKLEINEGGPNVWFHLDEEMPPREHQQNPRDPAYLAELNKRPPLRQAGDGVRAYVGLILELMCVKKSVLLIDEPELFLHPKQAERLGAIIAATAKEEHRQIIVATHTSAIVRGAISASNNVAVCRLTRQKNMNHGKLLNNAGLKQQWAKPYLRSVSSIEGIFYPGAVICEAETDTHFYEALLGKIEEGATDGSSDLYFVSGGGKGEIRAIVDAYRSLHINVAAIADLDLLQKPGEFFPIVKALGGNDSDLKPLYLKVRDSLDKVPSALNPSDLADELRKLVDEIERDSLPDGLPRRYRDKFTALFSDVQKWSEVKKQGIKVLKDDRELQAARELLDQCKSIGLFLVPVGVLESWCSLGISNKHAWARQAVSEIFGDSDKFEDAKTFVKDVRAYLRA